MVYTYKVKEGKNKKLLACRVRYATACHMGEEVRGGVQITKRGKVTSNISDIQEKWGKIIYPILVVIFFALLFYIMD